MKETVIFDEIKFHSNKSSVCPGCGKRATRRIIFTQTLNPFNKTKDGVVKDRKTIVHELATQATEWKKLPAWHVKCESK